MSALNPQEITQPGAYEWVDGAGVRHVGFLVAQRNGRLAGSFVSAQGALRAIMLQYSDGTPCEGSFYGPLPSAHQA